MKKQHPKSIDLEREASSWSAIDLALVAVRIAEEANAGPWCHRTPTGFAAWFTAAAMVTARLWAVDLETAADLVEQRIDEAPTDHDCCARALLVHPGTATWQ